MPLFNKDPQWLKDVKEGKTKIDNGDGSYSTMLSGTFTDGGKTYLYPGIRIINGKPTKLSTDEAMKYAFKNKDAIPFDSQDEADAWDKNFHQSEYGNSPLNNWGYTRNTGAKIGKLFGKFI